MRKLLLVILSFTCQAALAQQTTFSKVYYEPSGTGVESRSVVKTFDNGYLIAGKANYYMGYLLKTDANGVEVWNKFFNPSPNNFLEFKKIISTTDSCFVICGKLQLNQQNMAVLIKVNDTGDTLWSKTYSRTTEMLEVYNVSQTFDGGYIMAGSSAFISAPYTTMLIIKTNANGDLQWMQTMQANNHTNSAYVIKQDADSNYVINGLLEEQTGPSSFEIGMCLAKFSHTGAQLWAKKYFMPGNNVVWGYDFEITSSGYMCYLNYLNLDAVVKTDLQGNIVSGNSFSVSNSTTINDAMPKIKKTHDGGYVFVAGSCFGPNILYKVDSAGVYQWASQLFLNSAEIVETNNNELFIAGSGPLCGIRTSQVLWPQIGMLQTDSTGNLPGSSCLYVTNIAPVAISLSATNVTFTVTSGGVQGNTQNIIGAFTLTGYDGCVDFLGGINELGNNDIPISPNPAINMVTVKLNRFFTAQSLRVYDITGKKVKEEMGQINNSGVINVNVGDLPAGVYVVIIESSKGLLRQRFVKL